MLKLVNEFITPCQSSGDFIFIEAYSNYARNPDYTFVRIRNEIYSSKLPAFRRTVDRMQNEAKQSSNWIFPANKETIVNCLAMLRDEFVKYESMKSNCEVPTNEIASHFHEKLLGSTNRVIECIEYLARACEAPISMGTLHDIDDALVAMLKSVDKFVYNEQTQSDLLQRCLHNQDVVQYQIDQLRARIEALEQRRYCQSQLIRPAI